MTAPDEPIDLSIVVPVHDEHDNIEPLVSELNDVLGSTELRFEIVLVDDGSRDGTAPLIDRVDREQRHVRALHLRRRSGQTAAFDAGFKAARGRAVVTMDGDLQNDPRDIPRLLKALEQHDAVAGFRSRRADPWSRCVAARIANAVRNRVTGDDIIDTGCSLKAFRRECVQELRLFNGMHRFLPTLLRMDGRRVTQLPVAHRPRRSGRSKYGIADRLIRGVTDLLAVRWMKSRRLDYDVENRES